jgi:hypothetical protein
MQRTLEAAKLGPAAPQRTPSAPEPARTGHRRVVTTRAEAESPVLDPATQIDPEALDLQRSWFLLGGLAWLGWLLGFVISAAAAAVIVAPRGVAFWVAFELAINKATWAILIASFAGLCVGLRLGGVRRFLRYLAYCGTWYLGVAIGYAIFKRVGDVYLGLLAWFVGGWLGIYVVWNLRGGGAVER